MNYTERYYSEILNHPDFSQVTEEEKNEVQKSPSFAFWLAGVKLKELLVQILKLKQQ